MVMNPKALQNSWSHKQTCPKLQNYHSRQHNYKTTIMDPNADIETRANLETRADVAHMMCH